MNRPGSQRLPRAPDSAEWNNFPPLRPSYAPMEIGSAHAALCQIPQRAPPLIVRNGCLSLSLSFINLWVSHLWPILSISSMADRTSASLSLGGWNFWLRPTDEIRKFLCIETTPINSLLIKIKCIFGKSPSSTYPIISIRERWFSAQRFSFPRYDIYTNYSSVGFAITLIMSPPEILTQRTSETQILAHL